jgi:glycosyltransferase involved in cell wall biosynthesis
MRILEINKFYNAKRGADKHFLDVIALLKRNGHQVADFSMQQKDNEPSVWKKYFLSDAGYQDRYSFWKKIRGFMRIYSFEAHRKINLVLDEFQPDIVHIHNIYHQLDPTILFEVKKRRIPIVMTVHDFKIINPNHSLRLNGKPYRRCADGKYYQCFLDKCVKNSYFMSFLAALEMYWHQWLGTYQKNVDCYITPSRFVKQILTKWGMPEEKIIVLPHFNPNLMKKSGKQYSFSVADSYALYPGKISEEKGTDTLIDIFKNMNRMKLYLAGEIEPGFIIPKHPNIMHLGFVPADQLTEYMRSSRCVVSGSQLPETFGLIALEAISAGRPFVGFNAGAYSEIIRHGIDGFIANDKKEFADYIRQIADGTAKFDEQKLKLHGEEYGADRYYEKLNELFKKYVFNKNI